MCGGPRVPRASVASCRVYRHVGAAFGRSRPNPLGVVAGRVPRAPRPWRMCVAQNPIVPPQRTRRETGRRPAGAPIRDASAVCLISGSFRLTGRRAAGRDRAGAGILFDAPVGRRRVSRGKAPSVSKLQAKGRELFEKFRAARLPEPGIVRSIIGLLVQEAPRVYGQTSTLRLAQLHRNIGRRRRGQGR